MDFVGVADLLYNNIIQYSTFSVHVCSTQRKLPSLGYQPLHNAGIAMLPDSSSPYEEAGTPDCKLP